MPGSRQAAGKEPGTSGTPGAAGCPAEVTACRPIASGSRRGAPAIRVDGLPPEKAKRQVGDGLGDELRACGPGHGKPGFPGWYRPDRRKRVSRKARLPAVVATTISSAVAVMSTRTTLAAVSLQ